MHKAVLVVQILSTKLSILLGKTLRPLLYSIYCIGAYTVPKEIYFPRYNMKCSGENLILRGKVHVISDFSLHVYFMLYRGNVDCFSNSLSCKLSSLQACNDNSFAKKLDKFLRFLGQQSNYLLCPILAKLKKICNNFWRENTKSNFFFPTLVVTDFLIRFIVYQKSNQTAVTLDTVGLW